MELAPSTANDGRFEVEMTAGGFTIVQFFEKLGGMEGVAAARRPQAARYLGLALIACGIAALVISVWQYGRVMSHLTSGSFKRLAGLDDATIRTPSYLVALFLILVGVFAFVVVYLRAF